MGSKRFDVVESVDIVDNVDIVGNGNNVWLSQSVPESLYLHFGAI